MCTYGESNDLGQSENDLDIIASQSTHRLEPRGQNFSGFLLKNPTEHLIDRVFIFYSRSS